MTRVFMDKKKTEETNKIVMATYKFPNNNVATFGYDGKQIPELQGVYTPQLHDKIKQRSNDKTKWNGFNNI